jgi:hypothetical protein
MQLAMRCLRHFLRGTPSISVMFFSKPPGGGCRPYEGEKSWGSDYNRNCKMRKDPTYLEASSEGFEFLVAFFPGGLFPALV